MVDNKPGQLSVPVIARTSGVTETADPEAREALTGGLELSREKFARCFAKSRLCSKVRSLESQSPRDAEIIDMAAARGVEVCSASIA